MVDSIIQSFDIWTDAQGLKSRGRVKSIENISLEGIGRLRDLILELAVKGKLIPQDANDEPAIELLKKNKENSKLLKTTSSTINMDLPDGWAFAHIPDIVNGEKYAIKRGPFGSSLKKDYFVSEGYKVYEQQHAINNDFSLGHYYIDRDKYNELKAFEVRPNDIIISCSGTVGKVAVAPLWMEPGIINQALLKLSLNEKILLNDYFKILFQAFYMKTETLAELQGTAQKNMVSVDTLKTEPFPLPPLAEQHRIVAKVDELMALCDKLEEQQTNNLKTNQALVKTLLETLTQAADADELQMAWERISQHFDILFCTEDSIDQLKQTILQLAVMGKLVKQDPNDKPASVLLKRITAEKEILVKEGRLKKQSSLPEIGEDEKPFVLPKGWEWCRLSEIATIGTGSTPLTSNSEYYNGEIPWITSSATGSPFVTEAETYISDKAIMETNCKVFPVGTLIIAMYGQGKTRGQITELLIPAATNQACASIELINENESHKKFIKLFFQKIYLEIRELAEGGAQPNLNLQKIKDTLIPLPPLKEQEKIEAKIENLFSLCDSLAKRIQNAEKIKVQLSKTIVENAVQ